MGLFDKLGGQQNPPRQMDPRQMQEQMREQMQRDVGQIKANPESFLKERGFNIPEGMNDAQQITKYLLQTGQIGNSRLQTVMKMFGMSGR